MFEWACFLQSKDPCLVYKLILNISQIKVVFLTTPAPSLETQFWSVGMVSGTPSFQKQNPYSCHSFLLCFTTYPVPSQIFWIVPLQNILPFRHSFLSLLLSCLKLDPWHLSPAMFPPPLISSTCWSWHPPPKHVHWLPTAPKTKYRLLLQRAYKTRSQIPLYHSLQQVVFQWFPTTWNI